MLGVEVVRRDAQVGEDAIYALHAAMTQCAAHKAEVARYEAEALVVGGICLGIGVLIQREETPLAT